METTERNQETSGKNLGTSEKDRMYMRRCLQLARNGMQNARPNPMVGAVIVAEDGRIIGEGYHQRCGEGHAEVNAFASVRQEDEYLLAGSTIYVSLEPCAHYGKTPPCADLIVRKGVRRCVVGCVDPFAKVKGKGIQKIMDAGIEVCVGVLEEECKELNRRFFTYHSRRRPYILLKWAQSCSGFIDDNFRPYAFSTGFTKMLSHKLRAEEDAILVGKTTDDREHPQLTVRSWSGRNPKRIMLRSTTPLPQLMEQLYGEGVQSLIVEGGAKVLTAFIDAGLYDEIRIETAPADITSGTKAPQLPAGIPLRRKDTYGQNTILVFRY